MSVIRSDPEVSRGTRCSWSEEAGQGLLPTCRPDIGVQLTAYSLRYAPASGSSSVLAFGAKMVLVYQVPQEIQEKTWWIRRYSPSHWQLRH